MKYTTTIEKIEKLSETFDKYDIEVEDNHNYFANGVLAHNCRSICIVENQKATMWSRTGHQFETLSNVCAEVERICAENNIDNVVLDGEMCIVNPDGLEDFKSIVSQIKRKDYTVDHPRYKLFDMVDLKSFLSAVAAPDSKKLSGRFEQLNEVFANKSSIISVLEQIKVQSSQHLEEAMAAAVRQKWEGLILRKDCKYEGKRTSSMLKLKKFHDAEYVVTDVQVGPFRAIDKETGLEKEINVVTNVIIVHKGSKVSVGSGFSLDERKYYTEHISELKGAMITVQFFEETVDKDGNIRLRFPTVKAIYKNGRDC